MKKESIQSLLCPKTVAVIGVSQKQGSLGKGIYENIVENQFSGEIFAINPNIQKIEGVKVYPDLLKVPKEVDLVIVCVPQKFVAPVLDQCGKKGVKAVVLITAGYSELGVVGKDLERKIMERCQLYSMRILGPNCMGIINTDPEISLNASFSPVFPPKGNVALISQSGSLGQSILDYASSLGIGLSHFVSIGNRMDLKEEDFLNFLMEDKNTEVILFYLEDISNQNEFLLALKKIQKIKPMIALKCGIENNFFFKETGIQVIDTLDELFGLASLMSSQPRPKGNRLGILTNAGGPAHLAKEKAIKKNFVLPSLTCESLNQLKEFLPKEAILTNPLDMLPTVTPKQYAKAFEILYQQKNIDSILAIFVPPVNREPSDFMKALVDSARKCGNSKPILTNFLMSSGRRKLLGTFFEKKLPIFSFPEQAIDALTLFSFQNVPKK